MRSRLPFLGTFRTCPRCADVRSRVDSVAKVPRALPELPVSLAHGGVVSLSVSPRLRLGEFESPIPQKDFCNTIPGISDINLFRYCQSIVYFDAKIPDRAFDFGMAKQKLDSP